MTDDLYRQWGENIRNQRKLIDTEDGRAPTSGIKAMADALEVTPETVLRWEQGKLVPRDSRKIEIARYLRVDARMLFPLNEVAS